GFETKIRYEIINGFTSTLISDYVRAKNLNTNENLPQIPPFRLSVELRYATAKYWLGTIINLAASQNDVAPNEEPTAGYGLVSFYLGTKILSGNNAHIINLKIDNLFDKAYKDHLSAIKDFTYMPGRNISLNYKFIF
ncbi:MAG TPA: TonB-dependent receptor, partial [Ignavibacteriaceae bacterium]|nr:TonB-dependent receptor [Ignavibacteriaceae bacterium]